MAWTYFTALLDGTRPITKNQRNELYTAFVERVTASGRTDYSVPADILSSDLITDLVLYDDGAGTSYLVSMLSALRDLAQNYLLKSLVTGTTTIPRSTSVFNHVYSSGDPREVVEIAAAALSYPSALVTSLLFSRALDDYRLWNLIWKSLNEMVAVRITSFADGAYTKVGGSSGYVHNSGISAAANSDAAWALAISSFVSASETGPTGVGGQAFVFINRDTFELFGVDSDRGRILIVIPANSYFTSGYELRAFRRSDQNVSPRDLVIEYGFFTNVPPASDNTGYLEREVVMTSVTVTGSQTLTLRYLFHDAASGSSALRPATDGAFTSLLTTYTHFHVMPNFTKV